MFHIRRGTWDGCLLKWENSTTVIRNSQLENYCPITFMPIVRTSRGYSGQPKMKIWLRKNWPSSLKLGMIKVSSLPNISLRASTTVRAVISCLFFSLLGCHFLFFFLLLIWETVKGFANILDLNMLNFCYYCRTIFLPLALGRNFKMPIKF